MDCKIHGANVTTYGSGSGSRMCVACHKAKMSKHRRSKKDEAIEYKGGKCEICAYDRCRDALDFHHIDPTKKEFSMSAGVRAWPAVQAELDKCLLLCATCHREVHAGIHPHLLPPAVSG